VVLTLLDFVYTITYTYSGLILVTMAIASVVLKPRDWANRFLGLTFLCAGLIFLFLPIFSSSNSLWWAERIMTVNFLLVVAIPILFTLFASNLLVGEEKTRQLHVAAFSFIVFLAVEAYFLVYGVGDVYFDGRYHFRTGVVPALVLFGLYTGYLYVPMILLFRVLPKLEERPRKKGYLTMSGYFGAVTCFILATVSEVLFGDVYNSIFVAGVLACCYVSYYGYILK